MPGLVSIKPLLPSLAHLLVGVTSPHSLPVYQVRAVAVDQSTESPPVSPGRGHVVDGDPGVGVEEEPAPLLQCLASCQSHL